MLVRSWWGSLSQSRSAWEGASSSFPCWGTGLFAAPVAGPKEPGPVLKIRTCDGDLRTRRGDMQPVSSRPDARRAKSRRRPPCARPPRGQCEGQRRRERATDRPTGARTSPRAFDDPFVDCSGPGSPARDCVRGRPLPGPFVSRRDASPPGEAIPDRRWSRARRACIPAPQRSPLSQRSTSS